MKNKVKKVLDKSCTNMVKICTPKFCASGCLDYDFEDDYIVALNDVDVIFNNDESTIEHKDSICICDEYIISFEPLGKCKK